MHCSHVIWLLAASGRVPHQYFDGPSSGPHHEVIASNGYGCRPSVRVVLETIGLTISPGHTRGSRRRVPLQIWRTIVRTLQLWALMGSQYCDWYTREESRFRLELELKAPIIAHTLTTVIIPM